MQSRLNMEHSYSPTGTLVTKEALPKLQNLLNPILASWSLFAVQVGVPPDVVSQIETANARTSPNWLSMCLMQALQWWVANHRSPTYEAILAALDPKEGEMTPVMNRRLATKVREFMTGEKGLASFRVVKI